MKSRYIIELVVLIMTISIGAFVKWKTRRALKDIEDSGTIVKGNDFKGRVIDARDETEK